MRITPASVHNRGDEDVEDLAKQTRVLKAVGFVATCAGGCGTPLEDANQLMCTACARR